MPLKSCLFYTYIIFLNAGFLLLIYINMIRSIYKCTFFPLAFVRGLVFSIIEGGKCTHMVAQGLLLSYSSKLAFNKLSIFSSICCTCKGTSGISCSESRLCCFLREASPGCQGGSWHHSEANTIWFLPAAINLSWVHIYLSVSSVPFLRDVISFFYTDSLSHNGK